VKKKIEDVFAYKAPHCSWDEQLEDPVRAWMPALHRAFTLKATGLAMVNATITSLCGRIHGAR
jgi:hypothetical protein